MKTYKVKALLQADGWIENAYVTVDDRGKISSLSREHSEESPHKLNYYIIPGFQNAHSHAFQFAFAGTTENLRGKESDNFWSWREEMYNLALSITPEQMCEVATILYGEMLRVGYTHVAEFHYLHHDEQGRFYSNKAEMSEALMQAAQEVGLGLTLIPIFYQKGGFGAQAASHQRRFLSKDADEYFKLHQAITEKAKNYSYTEVGAGVHSLRAVQETDLMETFKRAGTKMPFHLHISEQEVEVEECDKFYLKRPVEWLAEKGKLGPHVHLVHATHIDAHEMDCITKSKTHVVLCPSTEANLGDGIFPLKDFLVKGGQFSIGTDSHIGLSPMEELRWLEYQVRLNEKKRNPLLSKGYRESGELLFHKSLLSGRAAMGNGCCDYFKEGEWFDAVCLDPEAPILKGKPFKHLLSTLLFASDTSVLAGTIRRGQLIQ